MVTKFAFPLGDNSEGQLQLELKKALVNEYGRIWSFEVKVHTAMNKRDCGVFIVGQSMAPKTIIPSMMAFARGYLLGLSSNFRTQVRYS